MKEQSKLSNTLPSISVIMPTLNSQRTIEDSLDSIEQQDYPKELVEIIITDGGSEDATWAIAKRYGAYIYQNPLKTAEAGKALGVKRAKNDILAFIDSDNVLLGSDWLNRMVVPFEDSEIVASEPLYYGYRESDSSLTRYFALLGMGDPFSLFLGNYDRYSFISNKWTGLPVVSEDKGGYLKITLKRGTIPTIGANGFLIRKEALCGSEIGDYLFDVDVLHALIAAGKNKVAKVDVGIVHLFSGDFRSFIRKQRRRIRDFLYFSKKGVRRVDQEINVGAILKFILYCFLLVPLIFQAFIGFLRKKDIAWVWHPFVCWATLIVYASGKIRGLFKVDQLSRRGWSQ